MRFRIHPKRKLRIDHGYFHLNNNNNDNNNIDKTSSTMMKGQTRFHVDTKSRGCVEILLRG